MSSGGNPWADPSTPTEPGAPYAGPPPADQYRPAGGGSPYGPPVYGAAPYGAPPGYGFHPYGGGYPPPGYGYPAPWLPPRRPQRPGQVIAAAVLAFVQGGIVAIASLYVWFFASIADLALAEAEGTFAPATVDALATEGTTLAIVQLVSAVLLIGAGIRALNARTEGARRLLFAAHAVQVVLSVYWAVRLSLLLDDGQEAGPLVAMSLIFAAGPVVSMGMLLTVTARSWFGPAPTR